DFRHDFVQTFLANTAAADAARFRDIFYDLAAKGRSLLEREGFGPAQTALSRSVDVRYVGQAHEVNVPLLKGAADVTLGWIEQEFQRLHEAQYRHAKPGQPVELVNCRLTAVGQVKRPPIAAAAADRRDPQLGEREVYFKEGGGWSKCPIYMRTALMPEQRIAGPAILEEHTTTTIVPPGFTATVDRHGNVLL